MQSMNERGAWDRTGNVVNPSVNGRGVWDRGAGKGCGLAGRGRGCGGWTGAHQAQQQTAEKGGACWRTPALGWSRRGFYRA